MDTLEFHTQQKINVKFYYETVRLIHFSMALNHLFVKICTVEHQIKAGSFLQALPYRVSQKIIKGIKFYKLNYALKTLTSFNNDP